MRAQAACSDWALARERKVMNRYRFAGALVCSTAACMLVGAVRAKATPYVVTVEQVGSDVVATGSGQFDLTGLTFSTTEAIAAGMNPKLGVMSLAPGSIDLYLGTFSGPNGFGTAFGFTGADNSTGTTAYVIGEFNGRLGVPGGYVSETALATSTSTYLNATLAGLGVTPGIYTWTWGSGADQSFTLEIGQTAISTPATLPLFITGLAGLGLLRWRRKNSQVSV